MNILTAFARIKGLFRVNKGPKKYAHELSDHLRKDIGLDNAHREARNKDHEPKRTFIVANGILTRGP